MKCRHNRRSLKRARKEHNKFVRQLRSRLSRTWQGLVALLKTMGVIFQIGKLLDWW